MIEEHSYHILKFSKAESCILTTEFTEKEFSEVISQMKLNKTPRPDGVPNRFYQHFLDVLKSDLTCLFE
jgi:hypothetical protein